MIYAPLSDELDLLLEPIVISCQHASAANAKRIAFRSQSCLRQHDLYIRSAARDLSQRPLWLTSICMAWKRESAQKIPPRWNKKKRQKRSGGLPTAKICAKVLVPCVTVVLNSKARHFARPIRFVEMRLLLHIWSVQQIQCLKCGSLFLFLVSLSVLSFASLFFGFFSVFRLFYTIKVNLYRVSAQYISVSIWICKREREAETH